jgi:putative ABC transport system permease protein
MIAVTLKGLAARKFRASVTALAIVLGVAMISGTYVLTDTINTGFDTIFSQSYKNTDAIISGKSAFKNTTDNTIPPPTFPESVLPKVKALPDVPYAAGSVQTDNVKLVGSNGKLISAGNQPSFGFSVDPGSDQRFNPAKLTAGSWASASDQVVIDSGTANKKHYSVGDAIGVQVNGPIQQFRISGIAKFTGGVSLGGATFAIFDRPTAQRLFQKVGQLDFIRLQSKSGVPTAKLVSEVKSLLPSTATVRSPQAQVKEDKKDLGFLSVLKYALLAFAGVAIFVGAFVIANTLGITIAQRMREFATLRTLGASRRQVLRSVVLEAFVIGALGSLVGLFLGLALAKVLNRLFIAIGINLPQGSTVFATRTIVVSLLVGTLITVLASLRPARRATPSTADRRRTRRLGTAYLPVGPVRARCGVERAPRGNCPCLSRIACERPGDGTAALCHRPGRAAALLRSVDERREGGSAACERPRLAGAAHRRRAGDPRPRQRGAGPGAHGLHRVGTHDRPRARHLRGAVRAGVTEAVRGRGRPAVHRGLRRDLIGIVLADLRRRR